MKNKTLQSQHKYRTGSSSDRVSRWTEVQHPKFEVTSEPEAVVTGSVMKNKTDTVNHFNDDTGSPWAYRANVYRAGHPVATAPGSVFADPQTLSNANTNTFGPRSASL
jgi:hypothetical protein